MIKVKVLGIDREGARNLEMARIDVRFNLSLLVLMVLIVVESI